MVRFVAKSILYYFSSLVAETFAFGAYSVIFGLSTRMLLQKKRDPQFNARLTRTLLAVTITMYIVGMLFWGYNVASLVALLRLVITNPQALTTDSFVQNNVTRYLAFFNALALINYSINDAFIVWRARRICDPDHQKYMLLPVFFVALTSLAALSLIGLRFTLFLPSTDAFRSSPLYLKLIDGMQVWGIIVSMLANTVTTGVVGVTAWIHRKTIREGFTKNRKTPGSKILVILVESGLIYMLAGGFSLLTLLVKLPFGTLGDVYFPFNVQVASAYTPVVLLLVHRQQQPSMKDPSFVQTIPDLNVDILDPSPSQTILGNEPEPVRISAESASAMSEKAKPSFEDKSESSPAPDSQHLQIQVEAQRNLGHRYQSSDLTLV